ncbi:hypothetical protein EVA_20446 [gut metagenome]|uniref:Uncharacterized protein n=1 Tax=gut metagenome TaxID=749906 RepID=J9F958_9ZZZZ
MGKNVIQVKKLADCNYAHTLLDFNYQKEPLFEVFFPFFYPHNPTNSIDPSKLYLP